jgi:hypothetical protein
MENTSEVDFTDVDVEDVEDIEFIETDSELLALAAYVNIV